MGDITRVMAQHEQLHPQQIADLEARLVRLYKETIKQDELRTQMKRELEEKKGTIEQLQSANARLVRLYARSIKQDESWAQMKRELKQKKGTIEQLHEQRQSANARVDELYARSIKQEDRVVILQASNDKLRERNALATFQEKKLQQRIHDVEAVRDWLSEQQGKHALRDQAMKESEKRWSVREQQLLQQIQDLETLLTEPGRKHDVVVADDNHALDAIHQAVASHDEPAD